MWITTYLAQSATWGCSCHKPDGTQTQKSESVPARSEVSSPDQLTDALWPFVPTACEHEVCRDPAPLAYQNGCFRAAQWHARHQRLVIFSRPSAEKLSCNLANLTRCTRGRLGPQRRADRSGSMGASPIPPARPSASR